LKSTLMRLIDYLKSKEITAVFTNLTSDTVVSLANSQIGVSSLMDTWIMLSNHEVNGERTRTVQVLKSRGMPHSNKVREFVLSDDGIALIDVVVDNGLIVTGRAREAHECRESHRQTEGQPQPQPLPQPQPQPQPQPRTTRNDAATQMQRPAS
jgi:circadian clock protein KaiC